jgi:NitT/TauT family transport system substrate-binding protein
MIRIRPRAALPRNFALAAVATAVALAATACGGSSESTAAAGGDGAKTVTLGFFPNITHAPALVGVEEGHFAKALGSDVTFKTATFNAGPEAIQALFSDAVDITYIGPNPTINGYAQSQGEALRVIAGAASGGAALVVKPSITGPAQLKGKKLASPQLGNTQDVALRYWLKQQGLTADDKGGGDVSIVPQKNALSVQAFVTGDIDGAWVPEPFASQLVAKGGKILVDEKTLWPEGKFVTTNIIASTKFIEQNPGLVRKIIDGHLAALEEIRDDPAKAQAAFLSQVKALTGQDADPKGTATAWKNIDFTADPLPATLEQSAKHAADVGQLDLKAVDAAGGFSKLYDLDPLNAALKADGQAAVAAP